MSTPDYVYILSDYEEHGAENVAATLDRTLLPALLEQWVKEFVGSVTVRQAPDFEAHYLEEARAGLTKALQETDAALADRDGVNLMSGWGGVKLYVARLFTG